MFNMGYFISYDSYHTCTNDSELQKQFLEHQSLKHKRKLEIINDQLLKNQFIEKSFLVDGLER